MDTSYPSSAAQFHLSLSISGSEMKKCIYILLMLLSVHCRERYDVPFNTTGGGVLVVEGFINTTGETSIRISRTTQLSQKNIDPEVAAIVQVEAENGSIFILSEKGGGVYTLEQSFFDPSMKYRLTIRLLNGNDYETVFRNIINTPPIDSLSWHRENEGVQIYVNSKDIDNDTRYYKYEFEETWEFKSYNRASLKFNHRPGPNGTDIDLGYFDSTTYSVYEPVYTCWQQKRSNGLDIYSTIKLADDIVVFPIRFYPKGAWEMSFLYSILVKQYALSAEGYDFFERMKKNTESLGSVFDALPSEITGNIQCINNPGELVIGHIEFCSMQEKRIFIDNQELEGWDYDPGCETILAPGLAFPYNNDYETINMLDSLGYAPTIPYKLAMGSNFVISFYAEPKRCVDCNLRGFNIKPEFWP